MEYWSFDFHKTLLCSNDLFQLTIIALIDLILPLNFSRQSFNMNIKLHIDYFEEDGVVVALCPELQVSSVGDTLVEAEKSIQEALELFLEGCEELGTLREVLEDAGYRIK